VKNADGSNSPFTIESSISLEDLRNTVAEKIGRHPNIVRLQYKLANDKVKALTTSIQNNDELQIFIERMRILLVPQRWLVGSAPSVFPPRILWFALKTRLCQSKEKRLRVMARGRKRCKSSISIVHELLVL